jgi:hypothetical protein
VIHDFDPNGDKGDREDTSVAIELPKPASMEEGDYKAKAAERLPPQLIPQSLPPIPPAAAPTIGSPDTQMWLRLEQKLDSILASQHANISVSIERALSLLGPAGRFAALLNERDINLMDWIYEEQPIQISQAVHQAMGEALEIALRKLQFPPMNGKKLKSHLASTGQEANLEDPKEEKQVTVNSEADRKGAETPIPMEALNKSLYHTACGDSQTPTTLHATIESMENTLMGTINFHLRILQTMCQARFLTLPPIILCLQTQRN